MTRCKDKYEFRKIISSRINTDPHFVYNPPKYLCVYTAESLPGFPREHLYRTIDATGLMNLVQNAQVCGISNLHLYLINHDKAPTPVDYLLNGNAITIYNRRGIYIERRSA